jgi:DNA/RNA endonuclease G (NUC1)
VSWDLTLSDQGSASRSSSFYTDTRLPSSFYHVTSSDYTNSGYDRGHMCPSADRTDTSAHNQVVFYMSNIVPQAPDNNQGPWEKFETYCRSLTSSGYEVLLISGPSTFNGSYVGNSAAAIPGYTWKVAVVVPSGSGTAVTRITTSTRCIALKVPNVQGIRSNPWQNYITSAGALQTLTGFSFFTSLSSTVRSALLAKVDSGS